MGRSYAILQIPEADKPSALAPPVFRPAGREAAARRRPAQRIQPEREVSE